MAGLRLRKRNPPVKLCFISDFPHWHYLHNVWAEALPTANTNAEGKHCI